MPPRRSALRRAQPARCRAHARRCRRLSMRRARVLFLRRGQRHLGARHHLVEGFALPQLGVQRGHDRVRVQQGHRPRLRLAQRDRLLHQAQRAPEQAELVVGERQVVQRAHLLLQVARVLRHAQCMVQAAHALGEVGVAAVEAVDGAALAAAVAAGARQRDRLLHQRAVLGRIVQRHARGGQHARRLPLQCGLAQRGEEARGFFGRRHGVGRLAREAGRGLAQQGQRDQVAPPAAARGGHGGRGGRQRHVGALLPRLHVGQAGQRVRFVGHRLRRLRDRQHRVGVGFGVVEPQQGEQAGEAGVEQREPRGGSEAGRRQGGGGGRDGLLVQAGAGEVLHRGRTPARAGVRSTRASLGAGSNCAGASPSVSLVGPDQRLTISRQADGTQPRPHRGRPDGPCRPAAQPIQSRLARRAAPSAHATGIHQ